MFDTVKLSCPQINLPEMCKPAGLSPQEQLKLDELVVSRRKVQLLEPLYSSGESFKALYAIQSGFFKTSVISTDGREQVTGFQMSGEFLGMDGIASDCHTCDAIALEVAQVCVMPFSRVCALARDMPVLQTHLLKLLSGQIVSEHNTMLLLGSMRAEERIASFLLNLSERMHVRGFSRSDLVLRMSRTDIGSFLGLKLETVSRTFSRMAEQGVLVVKQRNVHIRNPQALQAMLNSADLEQGAF